MKKNDSFSKLKFNFTDDMEKILIELIIIKEKLKLKNLDSIEKENLQKQKDKLLKNFKNEFQKNNKEEIKKYKSIINK